MNTKLKIAIIESPKYKNQSEFALSIGMTPDRLSKIINQGLQCVNNAVEISKALDKTREELGL